MAAEPSAAPLARASKTHQIARLQIMGCPALPRKSRYAHMAYAYMSFVRAGEQRVVTAGGWTSSNPHDIWMARSARNDGGGLTPPAHRAPQRRPRGFRP